MTLIDTSSWVEALRIGGDQTVTNRVRGLLLHAEAALCDVVLLELWNGARGEREKRSLSQLQRDVPCLPTSPEVWEQARDLARRSRRAGLTIPATDLLINACARYHNAALEHCDTHFDRIDEFTDR